MTLSTEASRFLCLVMALLVPPRISRFDKRNNHSPDAFEILPSATDQNGGINDRSSYLTKEGGIYDHIFPCSQSLYRFHDRKLNDQFRCLIRDPGEAILTGVCIQPRHSLVCLWHVCREFVACREPVLRWAALSNEIFSFSAVFLHWHAFPGAFNFWYIRHKE